jgi:hypothetical protein
VRHRELDQVDLLALERGNRIGTLEQDTVVAVGIVPTMIALVSLPPAAGMVSASMLVSVTPSNLPALYWFTDST